MTRRQSVGRVTLGRARQVKRSVEESTKLIPSTRASRKKSAANDSEQTPLRKRAHQGQNRPGPSRWGRDKDRGEIVGSVIEIRGEGGGGARLSHLVADNKLRVLRGDAGREKGRGSDLRSHKTKNPDLRRKRNDVAG